MCTRHAKIIDSDKSEYTAETLRKWKAQAQEEARQRVLLNEAPLALAALSNSDVHTKLRQAAEADLAVFRNTSKWPATSVALWLEGDGFSGPVTTSDAARVAAVLDDLILVAPPGMGKTTTLFQIAESILADNNGAPLVVPLGDWATEAVSILASILKRPAFQNITEAEFRQRASQPGVVMLLDGWNELDAEARKRARVQIELLQAELPELALVVSTRKQAFDVPFTGTHVRLQPLNEQQQMEIAIAMRGDTGAGILDEAWRTGGVRELVTIPLYLTALLSLPEGAQFPTTKEGVLRCFVSAHETEATHAEALHAITRGLQEEFLESLAVFASSTENTSITEGDARRLISEVGARLVAEGQFTAVSQPDPTAVLEVLVNNHVLMRAGDTPGVSFQHQQFQEWYASHWVERRIQRDLNDPQRREALSAEVFDWPVWEEAILFAIERMARGEQAKQASCGMAVLAAFAVHPILAAEMIYRSSDQVWARVGSEIEDRVDRWHISGKCDRAQRFMMNSGRVEFLDRIWPLITAENQQISLRALRNCRHIRPSLFGLDAAQRIKALPARARQALLHEIATRGGIDGLNLAVNVVKDDVDPEVHESVVDALVFRRADRHIVELLRDAPNNVFRLSARRHRLDWIGDPVIRKRLAELKKQQDEFDQAPYERLRSALFASDDEDKSSEVREIVGKTPIDGQQDAIINLFYEARNRYPQAVVEGLLVRLQAGLTMFYGADDMLASAGVSIEDSALLNLALKEEQKQDIQAEAAASVLGPRAVGEMVDLLLELAPMVRSADGKYDKDVGDRYHHVQARIDHVPGASLVRAVQARAAKVDTQQIEVLAKLLSRHPDDGSDRSRPFDWESRAIIGALVDEWANQMLASDDVDRTQMASVALLASRAPAVSSLPVLKRMLDENLRRYQAFREEAEAGGWQQGKAKDEAGWPLMHEYQRAFMAIRSLETTTLMREYLTDPHFGELAAAVLVEHWRDANDPPSEKHFFSGVDFSRVSEKRLVRASDPQATSEEAEAIFSAIESLIGEGATDDQKRMASELGIQAVRIPHGQREATIDKLIAITPRRTRSTLLLNLVLSGVEIESRLVTDGIAETFEAAKKEPWILTDSNAYQLRDWLRLLPFTNHPECLLETVQSLPEAQQRPHFWEEVVTGLSLTPSKGAEEVLFQLAERDPRFYREYGWRDAAYKLGTESAAHRLVELAADGVLDLKTGTNRGSRNLGTLIEKFPGVRSHVYGCLQGGISSPMLEGLARAAAESLDAEGLLLLVKIESERKQRLWGELDVEKVVTERVPVEGWANAYNIVSVPAGDLRKKLFAMIAGGDSNDAAARCLNCIDITRDEHGTPISEPHHPDIATGKPWPILAAPGDKRAA